VIYPKEHLDLAINIRKQGLLVSELPLGAPPKSCHFPRRNRLIAALALGVVVIEAAERSGSLITARLAAELGREVFALPGSIRRPLSSGCNLLIQQGAKLVRNPKEVLEELVF
jgi:DNA processing protein